MKKRISIICGSPRKYGNSAYTAELMLKELNEAETCEIELLYISDYDIDPCYGCRECMKLNHCCNQKDDFETVFKRVLNSDITIWAVPVYWFAPPGILKNFIDRTHGYFVNRGMMNGNSAYLINIATDTGFRNSENVMRSWLEWFGVKITGVLDIYATEENDIKRDSNKIKKVTTFIDKIKREYKIEK